MNGFFINWLRLTGAAKQPAEVAFEPGLNVIWGASDTGKSFIFSCIDFMLGRSTPPKKIKKRKGYESAWMGITLRASQERYVLERGLPGGDFNLHSVKPGTWEITDSRTMLAEHHPDRTDTISHFLLASCSQEGAIILAKKENRQTRRISFRDIAHLTFVDEERIIAERSPVYPTGQYSSATAELATFSYMISGSDWKGVVASPDIKVERATWRGKNELYQQLISELENEIGEHPPDPDRLSAQIAECDDRILEVNSKIEESGKTVATIMGARRQYWEEAQKARTRLAVIGQLQDRFTQLLEHYESDMQRLRFISEGDFFLAQLGAAHCPFCGDVMEEHSAERLQEEAASGSIQDAASEEMRKIAVNMSDLRQTLNSLTGERGALGTDLSVRERAISDAEKSIRDELEPRLVEDKRELAELVERKGKLVSLKGAIDRLAALKERHAAMGKEPKRRRKGGEPSPSPRPDPANLYALSGEIASVLKDWRFLKDGTVTFDSEMDLVVNGEPRSSRGKGIRAVLHSAFTVGMMNHCRSESLNHPGFVMLDSPLTSYKEKDYLEVAEDIKVGFFEALLDLPQDQQVIVFENKEPPPEVLPRLRGYRFSGEGGEGRQGFIP